MTAVALAAAALAVPAIFSAPVGSKATMADFGLLTTRDGVEGFAIADNFLAANIDGPFDALVMAMGRPAPITKAIEAAGIDPLEIAFEVLGSSDPADLQAFIEARDEAAAPEAVWVAAWGDDNVDDGTGISTANFVFTRVI